MFTNETYSCTNRVISIFQFCIRPVVRANTKVKFDADKRTNRVEMRAYLPNTAEHWTLKRFGICVVVSIYRK